VEGPGAATPSISASGPRPTRRAALACPDFRRFFVGQSLSSLGTWFHMLALSLLTLQLTDQAAPLGLIVALQWVPFLLLGAHAGALLDRVDARAVLLTTNVVAAALSLALAAVAATGSLGLAALGAFALAFGTVLPFERPAVQVLPVELVPPELASSAIGLSTLTQSMARLAGPALAGLTFAVAGPAWCFVIDAGSYVVCAAFLLRIDRRRAHRRPRNPARPGQVREGLAYLRDHRRLRAVITANALIGLLAMNFLVSLTAMVQITFGGDSLAVGLAHTANAVGAVVCGALMGGLAARVGRHLPLAIVGLAGAIALLAVAPTLPLFLLAGPLLGAAFVAYQSAVLDTVHRLTRPDVYGRMVSLLTMGTQGTTPVGSLVIGAVIDARSPRAALALGSGACVGAALIVRRVAAGVPAPPPPEPVEPAGR
jgi:MFS family permease